MSSFRRLVFGISPRETLCETRGFSGGAPAVRRRLESIGEAFVAGYHAALDAGRPDRLPAPFRPVDPERLGFAFEGAAMAFAVLDAVIPWERRTRWREFLDGAGNPHAYMVHVGAGWAHARTGGSIDRFTWPADPLLRWLALDGYGFHEGYFHASAAVRACRRPAKLVGQAANAFDQGLGRSLWFVKCAEPAAIAETIARFEPERAGDLWAGVGLAAAYAGGVDATALRALQQAAASFTFSPPVARLDGPDEEFALDLAQGAAFAAEARERAGNPAAHTELACSIFCNRSAREAAAIARESRDGLPAASGASCLAGAPADYELWRARIRDRFLPSAAALHA